jgi:TonB family protein
MSRRRLICTAVVLACVMGGAVVGTVVALPLGSPFGEAAAHMQQVVDGKEQGVTLPKVISEVKARYTPEAMRAKIEGTVTMTTVVRTDGTPRDIEITKSLDTEHGLDQQAVTALSQWRFEPGRLKDGKPVSVRIAVEMRFTLKK